MYLHPKQRDYSSISVAQKQIYREDAHKKARKTAIGPMHLPNDVHNDSEV